MRADEPTPETAQLWAEIPAVTKERIPTARGTTYRFVLPNDGEGLATVVEYFQDVARRRGLRDETELLRFGAALSEALNNSLYHGNLEVGSDLRAEDPRQYFDLAEKRVGTPPYRDRRLYLEADVRDEEIVVVVRDEGPGFDPDALPDPTAPENLLAASGRGVFLMRSFLDEVRYNSVGNEVTLTKRIPQPAHGANGSGEDPFGSSPPA